MKSYRDQVLSEIDERIAANVQSPPIRMQMESLKAQVERIPLPEPAEALKPRPTRVSTRAADTGTSA